jgi:hypothetical protein
MLRNITNTSVNVKMLSAIAQPQAPMLSATRPTLMLGQNLALKLHQFMLQINIHSSKYLLRKFLRFLVFLEGPKSTSISDHIYSH